MYMCMSMMTHTCSWVDGQTEEWGTVTKTVKPNVSLWETCPRESVQRNMTGRQEISSPTPPPSLTSHPEPQEGKINVPQRAGAQIWGWNLTHAECLLIQRWDLFNELILILRGAWGAWTKAKPRLIQWKFFSHVCPHHAPDRRGTITLHDFKDCS